MMFSMLIEPLLKEASHIGIITYDRLTDLYKRAFPDAEILILKTSEMEALRQIIGMCRLLWVAFRCSGIHILKISKKLNHI